MKYPIIICDDDNSLAEKLAQEVDIARQNLCDDDSNYENIESENIHVANTFEQAVGYIIVNDIKNGIYFLDIQLSQNSETKNGVDLAEFIKKQDHNAQIIFVTAYEKYASLTYQRRIGAIDYINKSDSDSEVLRRLEETLRNAYDNLADLQRSDSKFFIYKIKNYVRRINGDTIYFIENSTIQHKVRMVTESGESEFKGNISKLSKNSEFLVKVSQSYLVNPKNIDAINLSERTITFPNGETITFSRIKKNVVKSFLTTYEDIKVK